MKQWHTKSGYGVIRILSGRSNVFLLTNGTANILIDTSPKGAWKKLDKRLKGLGISRLDCLILTHSHYDHAENANRLKRFYNAKVFIHSCEVFYLATGANPVPRGTNRFTGLMTRFFARGFARFMRYEPCACDYEVDAGYDLSDFGFNACILHTPGHSKGSMSVIVDDEIAIVGDCMFGVFPWSVVPPFAEDSVLMVDSWGKLLGTNCGIFLPSHGGEKTRAQLKKDYDKGR